MERRIIPIIENYTVEDEELYIKTYNFIKGHANALDLKYTLKALPLARLVHEGQYRKGYIEVRGEQRQLPYLLHVLKVCSTLISLKLPLSREELDILYTVALLHDAIEDGGEFFPKGGIELVVDYGFPEIVYTTIKLLSKNSGADEYELNAYFNGIKVNKFALLVKLADRSHNVEDLYNMKIEKLHKYVKETRDYIYLLAKYGKQAFPELSNGIVILKSKIVSLTELTETIVEQHEEAIAEKDAEIAELKRQIAELNKKQTIS